MRPLPRFALTFLLLALAACSNKAADSGARGSSYTSAMQKMNAHDYESAIAILEPLSQKDPQNQEVKRKLMHAYAGAAGFEILKFKAILDQLQGKALTELKAAFAEFKRIHGIHTVKDGDVRRFYAQRLSGGFVKALDAVPSLTQAQYSRLNQAISLYEQLGFSYQTSSQDDNFQWGLLYSYRAIVNVKALCLELDRIAQDQEQRDNPALEHRFVHSFKQIVADVLKAYKLFRHSYDKLQQVSGKIEEFTAKVSGNRLKARVLDTANSVEELFEGFVEDNRNETADLLSRMLARARDNDFEGELRRAFGAFENKSPEVRYHENRLRAVTRVFFDQFRASHQDQIAELKNLFTDQLRAEIRQAVNDSLDQEKLDPLNLLYRDEKSTFHRMADVAKALADDVNVGNLRDEVRPSVQALIDLVDREQLRMFQEDLKSLLGDEKEILDEEAARRKEDLDFLRRQLGGRVKDLDQILKEEVIEPAKPVVDAASKPDPAMDAKIRKQVDQTQDFLKH